MSANRKIQVVRIVLARPVSTARLAGAAMVPALILAQGCAFSSRGEATDMASQAASTSFVPPMLPAVLKNVNNGLYVDVDGASTASSAQVWTWTFNGNDNQEWMFVPASTAGEYEIVNRNSGLCLDVIGAGTADGTGLQQYGCWGGTNQLYTLQTVNGNLQIVGVGSGRCLESSGTAAGSSLFIEDCGSATNQQWSVTVAPSNVSLSSGGSTVQNASDSFNLDDDGLSTSNGATIFAWPATGGNNQDWTFTSMGDGSYELVNVHSGLCLDVPGLSTATGQAMDQWSCNGGSNQRWYLYNVGGKVQIAGQGSSKCLATSGTTDGEPVTLQPCSTTTNTQQWTIAGASSGGSSSGGSSSGGTATCGGGSAQSSDIQIEVSSLQQSITGFGASSAWDGSFANASDPETLWSTTTGAGLSLLRIRYGDGLTIAQSAVQHGVTVWMTVWGTGSGGAQGGSDTTTESDPNGCTNGSMPVLTNPSGLASSIVSYVQNAKSNGVDIYAVSGANEPDSCGINTTTSYSPAELVTWIETLGPALANIGVKLMAPETENVCGFPSYFSAIQNASTAWNDVNIFASHEYGCGSLPSEPSIAAAGKQYWETEISTGTGDDGINDGLTVAETMHNDLTQASVNAWHFWWLYGTGNGVLYDTSTNVWTKRLWAMGNFARFVRPGYVRVSTSGPSSYVGKAGCSSNNSTTPCVTAYISQTNNTVAIVAINPGSSSADMSFFISENAPCSVTPYLTDANNNLVAQAPITVSGSRFTATLGAQSVTTFVGTP